MESLENLGIIVDKKLVSNSENMGYYKTIAEAMQNLHLEAQTERDSLSRTATIDSSKVKRASAGELGLTAEAEDLYSINKSLYNSSKLFPPTERDLDFESNRQSLMDIQQAKVSVDPLIQFNSFKMKPKNVQTERNAYLGSGDKEQMLSYFEVRV